MPKLSIIIVSFNVKYYLEQCLRSVFASKTDFEIEVLVVDNASADDSVPYLRQLFPTVRFLENSGNVGFGRANNMALRLTGSDYVLFLNPDTLLAENTLSLCVETMEREKEVAALGVRMQYADGHFALESRRSLPTPWVSFCKMSGLGRLFPRSARFSRYHLTYLDNSLPTEIDVVSGAFMFCRGSVVRDCGGFDEDFFMYGEDIDLSFRMQKAGYKNMYIPVPILHYKGESTVKTSYRYVRSFYGAMSLFFDKHFKRYNLFFSPCVKLLLLITKLTRYVRNNLARRSCKAESRSYIFVGSSENFPVAGGLFARDGGKTGHLLLAGKEGEFTKDSLPEEWGRYDYIVFDRSQFSYGFMLQFMVELNSPAISLGVYHPESSIIVTEKTVLA